VDRLRRRPRRTIAGLLLFAFVLLLVVVIMRALSLRADATEAIAHLREAQTVIHAGGFELSSEDAERAGGLIELADASLARVAASLAGDPVMSLARLMPVLSEQIAAADDLIHAARLLTSRIMQRRWSRAMAANGWPHSRDSSHTTATLATSS